MPDLMSPQSDEYASIEDFYSEDERRRLSPEADYGVWWVEGENPRGPWWKVSYVRATGEVYAVEHPSGRVKLLGSHPVDDVGEGEVYYQGLNWLLDGWAQLEQKQLHWVVERLKRGERDRIREQRHGRLREHPYYPI